MRAALFVMVAALGCSDSDSSTLGGPCSLTSPCGSSEVCDFTADGGPVCIEAAGDVDGDGLTNDKDFCNHAMGGQYDEDQDGIGDDCDRCPIAPPPAFPDSDGDAVDAPCDPDTSTPGDTILLFDGFSNGLSDAWTPTTPSAWTVRGGELIGNLAGITGKELVKTTVIGKNNVAVDAGYRVDKLETGSTQHTVSVLASDPRPAGVSFTDCGVTKADSGAGELALVQTNQGSMSKATDAAFNSANLYRAAGYASGTKAGCVVLSNNNPLGVLQAVLTPDQLTQVSLTAQATSVRFQYVLVVGH